METSDIGHFHALGYAGPFTALEVDEMASQRAAITELLATPPNPFPERGFHTRHVGEGAHVRLAEPRPTRRGRK